LNVRQPGSVFDGKYEIVQRLGGGGMGEVYLVRHLHLQELRVVKILRQDLAADPSAQKRFVREARLATQVKHPNLAILYDFASLPDGSFYMVWEHIEGQDVGDRIRTRGPFPVPLALQLGMQALRGLEAVHGAGVIHRDLSPDNLMITEDRRGQSQIKIIDLGLAKALEPDANFEITQVGMFMGKLRYCSPEQAGAVSGGAVDHRSDLYSLALVLYEMISGLPPFDSENQHGFIFKRLSEDPLPLVGRNPRVEVPAELGRVMRRALERDPENRFPDATRFIAALEGVAAGLRAAETQEIPLPAVAAAERPAPPPPAAAPRQHSSSELSRAEKLDLLAQIERAGKRAKETAGEIARAEAALAAGKLEEAQKLVAQLEAASPRAAGIDRVKERLAEAQAKADRARRVVEAERVLNDYLHRKQLALARLALETLLDLAPDHPSRADYEKWVELLVVEVEQDKRVQVALAAGRAALARRDFATARRELAVAEKNDLAGERAEAFKSEIDAAERDRRQSAEFEQRKRRLEELLAGRKVEEAEREIAELAKLEVPRVTLDSYRERLAEVRSLAAQQAQAAAFEQRYRQSVQARDWSAARDVARELDQALPAHPRAAAMFAEVERLETIHRREQALEQGVRQVEGFLAQGDAQKAELAFKILLQMDPENRHKKRLERQIKGLKGGR
jgi:tRNA A-37 threonylcarbamoyl transferase component Bud32